MKEGRQLSGHPQNNLATTDNIACGGLGKPPTSTHMLTSYLSPVRRRTSAYLQIPSNQPPKRTPTWPFLTLIDLPNPPPFCPYLEIFLCNPSLIFLLPLCASAFHL